MIFYGYNSTPAKSGKGRQSEIPNQTAHLQKSYNNFQAEPPPIWLQQHCNKPSALPPFPATLGYKKITPDPRPVAVRW